MTNWDKVKEVSLKFPEMDPAFIATVAFFAEGEYGLWWLNDHENRQEIPAVLFVLAEYDNQNLILQPFTRMTDVGVVTDYFFMNVPVVQKRIDANPEAFPFHDARELLENIPKLENFAEIYSLLDGSKYFPKFAFDFMAFDFTKLSD